MKNIILISLIFCSNLFASSVEITSDSFYADNSSNKLYFIDNVKIKKEKDRLSSNLLIVYFNENNETEKYEASGDVKFNIFKKDKTHYKGSADSIEYIVLNTEYILLGNAIVKDLSFKRDLYGDKIILNISTGDTKVNSKKDKPSKFIFEMED